MIHEVLSIASVAVISILCTPSFNGSESVIIKLHEAFVIPVPSTIPLDVLIVIIDPTSPLPTNVGVASEI